MAEGRRGAVLLTVGYAAAYVGSAWVLSSSVVTTGFSPWYPPAGLTLAYLTLGPRGPWAPLVAVGVRLLNTWVVFPEVWDDEPDGVVLRAVVITAAYAGAGMILRRARLELTGRRELVWFAVVAVAGAPGLAAVGVALVGVGLEGASAARAFDAAATFWVGDAVAVVAIVPPALVLSAARRGVLPPRRLPTSRASRDEAIAQAAVLIVVPVLAVALSRGLGESLYLGLALVPAVWVAVQRDLMRAVVGLFVLTGSLATAASLTMDHEGSLADLQAVLLAASLTGLYLAATNHSRDLTLAELTESEDRYRSVVASAPDLVLRLDADGGVRFASDPTWLAEAGGVDAVVADLRARWSTVVTTLLDGSGVRSLEWERRAGDEVRAFAARLAPERRADGAVAGVVAVVTDLTPQRRVEREREEALRRDRLTGLANRAALVDHLRALDPATVEAHLAVLVVDLDRFESVNATLGHEVGDAVLRRVAGLLVAEVPDALVVARLAGNEFAVAVLADDESAAVRAGERILAQLRTELAVDGGTRPVTGSIGVAVGARTGGSALDVFADAEAAMQAAKENGRDRLTLFDVDRRSRASDRRAAEALLRRCLAERQVVVHYQPIVDLGTGARWAVEALARLRDDDGTLLMPDRFIDVAEHLGLDEALGSLVLDTALAELAAAADPRLEVHVNVTPRQLAAPGFAAAVLAACAAAGVAPERLCLELTETLVMADPEAAIATLARLQEGGVRAMLDDFGTGYSSIAHLGRLPLRGVKVDRSFVDRLPDDPAAQAVIRMIVELATSLDLAVVAEGVEVEAQARCLQELGCRMAQGYLVGRPGPLDEVGRPVRPTGRRHRPTSEPA